MFRLFVYILILLMPAAGWAADGQSQPWNVADNGMLKKQGAACKKVKIQFACRRRGRGKVTLPCRAGENEARCCARWKAKHTNPRSGLCTGPRGGVVSYSCSCAGAGGPRDRAGHLPGRQGGPRRADRLHAPGPGGPKEQDRPTAPGVPGGPPDPQEPPVPSEPEEPSGLPEPSSPLPGTTSSLPGSRPSLDPEPPCVDRFGGRYRRHCLRVSTRYFCKGGGSGYKAHGCGKGQSQADCCRKAMASVCKATGLNKRKTGKIQGACRCVKWSKWKKCGGRRR